MNLTDNIDRIETALLAAYNTPGTAEHAFAETGLPPFKVMRYLEERGVLTAAGAWIGDKPTRLLAALVYEECGAPQTSKKKMAMARTSPDPVETILLEQGYITPRNEGEVKVFERAMSKRRDIPPIPDALKDPDRVFARAKNYQASNVMTREQWEQYRKTLTE